MEKDIRTKIVTALGGVAGITGGIWFGKAPESTATPYLILSMSANESDRDTVDSFEEYYLQASAFDKADNPDDAESISNDVYDALDEVSLTLTNYHALIMLGLKRPFIKAEEDGYWQGITEYKLKVQKK